MPLSLNATGFSLWEDYDDLGGDNDIRARQAAISQFRRDLTALISTNFGGGHVDSERYFGATRKYINQYTQRYLHRRTRRGMVLKSCRENPGECMLCFRRWRWF